MKILPFFFTSTLGVLLVNAAYANPGAQDRVYTADGKEVWVVVRGENYVSVIDPNTYQETRRIETTAGPGMVLFHPNGKLAFVVSSFNPVVEIIDVNAHKVIKQIKVVSPFSPF